MKFDGINDELKQKVKELLDNAENKSEAIFEAADMIATAKNEKLIRELTEQNARAAADEDYRRSLGLHVLSKEEKEFYEKFKDIKQAITASQIDILPTSIVDRTLDDVKKASDVLSLVEFAPADVKKWIVATHSGAAVWGDLTAAITGVSIHVPARGTTAIIYKFPLYFLLLSMQLYQYNPGNASPADHTHLTLSQYYGANLPDTLCPLLFRTDPVLYCCFI